MKNKITSKKNVCGPISNPYDRSHLKYAICVSGSAKAEICNTNAPKLVEELGRQIALNNAFLITGATTGMPNFAAKGCKEAGGISIGVSPAESEKDHIKRYKLPTRYYDLIMYTGFGYSGRNLFLTRMADAVINVCGRIGTLNEFSIAFEDKKPIGIMEDTGGLINDFRSIVERGYRGPGKIAYDQDPKQLVKKVIKLIDLEKPNNKYNHLS